VVDAYGRVTGKRRPTPDREEPHIWHLYDFIEPGSITELLAEIDADPTVIFWG
jgi:hypothetical protein